MKTTKLFTATGICIGLLATVAIIQNGCQSSTYKSDAGAISPGTLTQPENTQATSTRGAAEIWATTCIRCHNSRSPASYSDAEWDIAMMHMRIQANLTADDYRTIREFLKASN